MTPDNQWVRPTIYSRKPRYCFRCGRKMRDIPLIEYDQYTGVKIDKGVDLMKCSDEWCITLAMLDTDGSWKVS